MLTSMHDYGMDPQEAIDAPRSFPAPDGLELETGYPETVAAELAARGHRVTRCSSPLGGAQAILIDHANGLLMGASDPRKDGCALGS
jgi:gamma-glutamyltranspeptidase/glutathione hydrolase